MRKSRHSLGLISLLTVVGVIVLINILRSVIKPIERPSSSEIERLAIATTMTPKAQQLFYQQDPEIQPKEKFRSFCRKPGQDPEKTIILGCFTSNGYQGSIVIQAVSDPRLEGTMEVVAAHEMLHAAYQELNPLERSRLEPKLKQAAKRVEDPNLQSILEAYEAGDPDIYVNELHSHLGTSLEDFGDPDLETYYQQYFHDRQQVVALAKRSRQELTQLDAQADQLKPQIDDLERRLKSWQADLRSSDHDLQSRLRQIKQMRSALQDLRQEAQVNLTQGDPSLVSQFKRDQNQFNAAVRQYNDQVEHYQDQLDQYNQQVEIYEQTIAEYNALNQTKQSILSSLQNEQPTLPVPQIVP